MQTYTHCPSIRAIYGPSIYSSSTLSFISKSPSTHVFVRSTLSPMYVYFKFLTIFLVLQKIKCIIILTFLKFSVE